MADFIYKTTMVTGATTIEEAKQLAVIAYLRQFGEPTQQAISDLLSEIQAEESERVDFGDLEDDIDTELVYLSNTLSTIDNMTNVQVREVVKRVLQEQQRELKAWRYIVRKLVG